MHIRKTSIQTGLGSGEFATFREQTPPDLMVPKGFQSVTMRPTPAGQSMGATPLHTSNLPSAHMYRSSSGDPTPKII